jgi:uncharacterized iron-regulated membrane protein
MPGDQIVFLAVSFVLIALWTGYYIWRVRKSTKLWREIEKLNKK